MHQDRKVIIRKSTLAEQGNETDLMHLSPGERMGMIEQITIDAWAMRGENIAEQRLQRHVVCLKRGGS